MRKLEVYDPAMYRATVLCGVDVDPQPARFAAAPPFTHSDMSNLKQLVRSDE